MWPQDTIEYVSDPDLYSGQQAIAIDSDHNNAFGTIERLQTGWRQSRYDRAVTSGGLILEGRSRAVGAGESLGNYRIGDRVFHQKFGYGQVMTVDGDRLQVAFDKAGTKKIIDTFVESV